jgi:DUF2934 family protein
MAKRPTSRSQSQADDTAAAAAPARPRSRRARGGSVEAVESSPAESAIASSEPSESAESDEPMGLGPSEDDIRIRAYHRYLERGGGDGMDFEDWLEAERELKRSKNA